MTDSEAQRCHDQRLREVKEKYERLAESTQYGVFICDLERFLWVNQRMCEITGHTRNEILAMTDPVGTLIAPSDGDRVAEQARRRIHGESAPSNFMVHGVHKGGQELLLELAVSSVTHRGRRALQGAVADVTDRERAREELAREKAFSDAVLNAITETVYVFDPETGRAVYWNRAMGENLGYSDADVADMLAASTEYYSPEDVARLAAATQQVLREGHATVEASIRAKDGTYVPYAYSAVLLQDRSGRTALCAVGRDVSERRQAERAREASEAQTRAMLDALPDLVFSLDRDGTHLSLHAPKREALFAEPGDIIGRRVDELLPEDVAARYRSRIAATLEQQSIQVFEYSLSFAEDDIRHYEARMVPQKPGRVLTLVRDVTERQRAAEERQQLELQLQQAQKMEAIGTLAGGVAHDMNNILGGIMMLSGLVALDDRLAGALPEEVAAITNLCKRGSSLTQDLLGFARKGKRLMVSVVLPQLVREVSSILRHTVARTIEIELDLQDDVVAVQGDPDQLRTAVMNLCLNAVDAMSGKGRLSLSCRNEILGRDDVAAHPDVEPGTFVCVSVADTGSGMTPEISRRALEPFFTTKPPGKGTGLGLSMAYGTARNHGGLLSVQSVVGHGTSVAVYLPAAVARVVAHSPSPRPKGSSPAQQHHAILLVDDEEMIRLAGKKLLERAGHRVVLAKDGQEALERCRRQEGGFTLVILDLTMPLLDGVEAFSILRQEFPDLPIVLASGHSKEGKADQLLRAGAAGFVQKPFGPEELEDALAAVLG